MLHVDTPKINKITLDRIYLFLLENKAGYFAIENDIPSLRSQSRDIAQYPEIANQSNWAILGGSRVAHTNRLYLNAYWLVISTGRTAVAQEVERVGW